MGAIVHAMGAVVYGIYALEAIVCVLSSTGFVYAIFLAIVVCAIHATGAVVYATYDLDTVISVIHVTEGVVCAIHVLEDFVGAIHVKEDSVCAIHVTDGFVGVIHATDGSAYVTGAVIFATGLFFFVSTSSMGDVSAIPAIARKRKFGSHRHQCKRGEKRNKISNAAPIRNSSAKKTP